MQQEDPSEEASHFEQVLGRLDALLKRSPTATGSQQSVKPAPSAEPASLNIPVLTEVYEDSRVTDAAKDEVTPQTAPEDYGAIVERVQVALMPLLNEAINRVIAEETALVLDQLRASLAERLPREIEEAMHRKLRRQLQAIPPEGNHQAEI